MLQSRAFIEEWNLVEWEWLSISYMNLNWLTGTVTHPISSYILSNCSLHMLLLQESLSTISSPLTLLIASQYKAKTINALFNIHTSSRSHIYQSLLFLQSVLQSASHPNNFQWARYTRTNPVGMNKCALLLCMSYWRVFIIIKLHYNQQCPRMMAHKFVSVFSESSNWP